MALIFFFSKKRDVLRKLAGFAGLTDNEKDAKDGYDYDSHPSNKRYCDDSQFKGITGAQLGLKRLEVYFLLEFEVTSFLGKISILWKRSSTSFTKRKGHFLASGGEWVGFCGVRDCRSRRGLLSVFAGLHSNRYLDGSLSRSGVDPAAPRVVFISSLAEKLQPGQATA